MGKNGEGVLGVHSLYKGAVREEAGKAGGCVLRTALPVCEVSLYLSQWAEGPIGGFLAFSICTLGRTTWYERTVGSKNSLDLGQLT